MRSFWALGLAVLVVAMGCASGGGGRISAESLEPCDVNTPVGEDWRQVVAEELSFCVPAGWRAMGSNGWRGGGGSLTWGLGEPRPRIESTLVTVRASEMPPAALNPTQQRRFSEQIGGVPVELWLTEWQGRFLTGATWTTPRSMYMNGEAISQRDADALFEVYRTVRVKSGMAN